MHVDLIAHRPPEDASRRAEVERATLRVRVVPLLLELHVFHLVADDCRRSRINRTSRVHRGGANSKQQLRYTVGT